MIPLWIKKIKGPEPETFIMLKVEATQDGRGPWFVAFDREHRDLIFNRLAQSGHTMSPQAIFNELKAFLDRTHRNLDLQPKDICIYKLADYIGFLRGYWPDPYRAEVRFYNSEPWGMRLLVPQKDRNILLNVNQQRFIYNETKKGRTARQISSDLDALHKREGIPYTPLEVYTVGRLRYQISGRYQEKPEAAFASWAKVQTPYAPDETPTVRDESLLPQKPLPQEPEVPVLSAAAPPARPRRSSPRLSACEYRDNRAQYRSSYQGRGQGGS